MVSRLEQYWRDANDRVVEATSAAGNGAGAGRDVSLTNNDGAVSKQLWEGVARLKLDDSRYTHREQVQARMDFLEYVLLNSTVEIGSTDKDHISVMWTCFV